MWVEIVLQLISRVVEVVDLKPYYERNFEVVEGLCEIHDCAGVDGEAEFCVGGVIQLSG